MADPSQFTARLQYRDELKKILNFCLWAVLIGPVVQILLWAVVEGSAATWHRLLNRYLLILLHFLCYTPVFGAGAFLLRSRLVRRTWALLAFGSTALALLASACAIALSIALGVKSVGGWPESLLLSAGAGVGMTALVLSIEWVYHTTVTSRIDAQRRLLESERTTRAAVEAQWNSLESRLHPHFLFNTLSSIRELMHRDVAEADIMIQRFASLIRFSLDSSQNKLVPLAEELETVSQYLQIEKMRLGARLRYDIAAAPDCSALPVPPLSVLTLVENSIKHAIACRRSGGCLEIRTYAENNRVRIEVCDDGAGFDQSAISPGHGLDLLCQRLQTLYPRGSAALLLPAAQSPFVVTLLIPATPCEGVPSQASEKDAQDSHGATARVPDTVLAARRALCASDYEQISLLSR